MNDEQHAVYLAIGLFLSFQPLITVALEVIFWRVPRIRDPDLFSSTLFYFFCAAKKEWMSFLLLGIEAVFNSLHFTLCMAGYVSRGKTGVMAFLAK